MSKILNLFLSTPLLLLISFGLALTCVSESAAQATSARSIEVIGTGKASAKPDRLLLKGFITAEDKTAKKVLNKFLKIKKSLQETVNPMDFPEVEIEFENSQFNTNFDSEEMMMGGGDGAESDGYYLSQPIGIRIVIGEDDAEKTTLQMLSKLVDAAETSGVSFNEAADSMMSFSVVESGATLASGDLSDREPLKQEATKKAFEDAKSQAQELAELAGGKLGKVISIEASSIAGEDNPWAGYMTAISGLATAAHSDSLTKIEVSQSLQVKFELTD